MDWMRPDKAVRSLHLYMHRGVAAVFLLMFFLLTGCALISPAPTSTPQPTLTQTATFTQTSTTSITPSMTFIATLTITSTTTPSASATSTASHTSTSTFTPVPTYEILRGMVNVDRVMCFYGPHRAYLFKYGLLGGSNLEIIGILPDTAYIQVRAIGGDNPCWMNLEWMDVRGDIAVLQPIDPLELVLPQSPFYGPLSGVSAVRSGNEVTLSWNPLYLRAGDDSEQEPYLVETWVCQNGKLTFVPIGATTHLATVTDEPGCSEPSHGRVYGVEKHGYTRYVEIPWPAAE